MSNYNFEVLKHNLREGRIVEVPAVDELNLEADQAVLSVERFAMTANTVTYGVAGESFGYWKFFPAEEPMGRIPVWGIGRVLRGGSTGLREGDRYYGYFPMSTFLVVQPTRITPNGFFDGSVHRSTLSRFYNPYSLMSADRGFPPRYDNHQMVYRPLFTTGFALDNYLVQNDFFRAASVVLTSASSKTAIALAYMLRRRRNISIIGLTSDSNADFVRGLSLYDQVATYDHLSEIPENTRVTIVDMAGNQPVVGDLRRHFKNGIVNFCGVGATHWDAEEEACLSRLPGAAFEQFFAPTQIEKIIASMGIDNYNEQLSAVWNSFLGKVDDWIHIRLLKAPDDIETAYLSMTEGANPAEALVFVTEG